MDEQALRGLIAKVKVGKLSRRAFVHKMVALGLTAPMASQMLDFCGVAQAQAKFEYKPTKRGGGGALKVLWWQGATLLNPHFAVGTKDQEGSRIFYEPLAGWDEDGNLVPMLAAEIPSRENGGLAADGMSVTWKLKQGVQWHDGKPFTADDVVFNWQYASDPATAAVTIGSYKDVKVEKVDDFTVRVIFAKPTPFWADAFVGTRGMLIPKHLFADYIGAKSRDAPANLKPVGTGPYKFVDFKPGDIVKGEINTDYHVANRPHFDTHRDEGRRRRGLGRARRHPDRRVRLRLEHAGRGRDPAAAGEGRQGRRRRSRPAATSSTSSSTAPIRGPRSTASARASRPSTRCSPIPPCRKALAMLVDRKSVAGPHLRPHRHRHRQLPQQPASASARRTRNGSSTSRRRTSSSRTAGWKKGPDGIRAKDGKKLKFVYQTSINTPRQKNQAIVKQACQKAGIDMELKSVTASVFFSSDVANPDTYTKFYCDIQMYTTTMTQPDPEVFMNQFTSWEVATKENKWQGRNITRWTERGVRQDVPRRGRRARSGQARGSVHPHERPGVRRPGGDPGRLSAARCRHLQQAQGARSAAGTTTCGTCRDWYREA